MKFQETFFEKSFLVAEGTQKRSIFRCSFLLLLLGYSADAKRSGATVGGNHTAGLNPVYLFIAFLFGNFLRLLFYAFLESLGINKNQYILAKAVLFGKFLEQLNKHLFTLADVLLGSLEISVQKLDKRIELQQLGPEIRSIAYSSACTQIGKITGENPMQTFLLSSSTLATICSTVTSGFCSIYLATIKVTSA